MITRSNLAEQLREYQIRSKHDWASVSFFSCTSNLSYSRISVTFMGSDGEETSIKVPIGMSMLEVAHENDIELEGACEGSLACSTCHVIVMDMEHYNKLEEPTDEENDMLDLAFGLTETHFENYTKQLDLDGFMPLPNTSLFLTGQDLNGILPPSLAKLSDITKIVCDNQWFRPSMV